MKKALFLSFVILSCMCLVLSCVPVSRAESTETCKLQLSIEFDNNLMFSKYNVKLILDGKQIALMQHGNQYTDTITVSAGDHVISFVKEDDNKINGRAEVYVEGETTFSCKIHATRNEVEVSELKIASVPAGQEQRTQPLKTITFGRYEQDNKTSNGAEPIVWYVLEEKDGMALLLSKDIIDEQVYDENGVTTWNTSSLRKWLNSSFISSAFTEEEQSIIQTTVNENMQATGTGLWLKKAADDTEDRVFLLSYNEYMKYLQLDTEKDPAITENAGSKNRSGRIWLRSPGKKETEMQYFEKGTMGSCSVKEVNAVRPAMWINMEADRSAFSYECFNSAEALEKNNNYAEAAVMFENLNGYNGSEERAQECWYQHAALLHKDGDYAGAIEILEKIKGYKDSSDLILDYKYCIAVEYTEKGDYSNAVKLFTEVGQYKQTMDYIRTCFDKLHIQYYWLTSNIGSVVNTGLDTGYSQKGEIKSDDPHFGWSLGRFMLSGFTEVREEGSKLVFIKTPGDSVTLWFDLNQDIDRLNNDEKLLINRDNGASDQEFQFPKSDFGKGALLMKHVDFRGSDTAVQSYLNYLAAKNGTGADTHVEINEEGKYEVALDYEIEKKELFSKYYNYRIYTEFEVRNGSGMFFMFDVATGSELEDYSRTADGFRIDLANSHALSISYVRYAMNQDETGLDVRKSEPAADGDTFEKVGYYVITATNKETGEQLIKHIFVGRAADLVDYQAVDETLSKFSEQ